MVLKHKADYWIKNKLIDASIKDINGYVRMHLHEFYEFEIILEGSGTYTIDGIDYEIKKGSLYAMSPGSFHYINFTEETKLINIMFVQDVCDFDFLCGIFKLSPHVEIELSEKEINYYHMLAEELVGETSAKYQAAILNCILGKIASSENKSSNSLKNDQMQRAILYIHTHFREGVSLGDAAKVANYSANYFGNKFKEYTGTTFKDYIQDLKFSLASKLLKHTTLTVGEISDKCGFKDFSNFMVYFKKKYKMTPGQYRENEKEQCDFAATAP